MNVRILLLLAAPLMAQDLGSIDTTIPSPARGMELGEVVLSGEKESTMKAVVSLAEQSGGWFQSWSADQVELRIPRDSLASFEARLATLGRRVDRQLRSQDLSLDFEDQLAGLSSRVRLLDTWSRMQESARDPKSVLDIQKELALLAGEIDRRRGVLAHLRDRVAYTRVVLDFRFQGRQASDRAGQTAFPWLNRLDLQSLQGDFR